jgi:hypothetical protein
MKKRHASKDHLTTIVRVSFIVMSISLFICGLAMPDFSDMEKTLSHHRDRVWAGSSGSVRSSF